MTNQRRLIYKCIQEAAKHLTAEEIYLCCRSEMPSIAVGTVYRNLKLMEQAGEIRRIPSIDGPDRYDKNLIPHEHAVCRDCGTFFDLDAPEIREAIQRAAEVRVLSYELQVTCLCPNCDSKRRKETV